MAHTNRSKKIIYFFNANLVSKISQGLILATLALNYTAYEFNLYISYIIFVEILSNILLFGSNSALLRKRFQDKSNIIGLITKTVVLNFLILTTLSYTNIGEKYELPSVDIGISSLAFSTMVASRSYLTGAGLIAELQKFMYISGVLLIIIAGFTTLYTPPIKYVLLSLFLSWTVLALYGVKVILHTSKSYARSLSVRDYFIGLLPFSFRNNLDILSRYSGLLLLLSQFDAPASASFGLFLRVNDQVSSFYNILFVYFLKQSRDNPQAFWRNLWIQLIFTSGGTVFFLSCIYVLRLLDLNFWFLSEIYILQFFLVSSVFGVLKTNFSIWEYWDNRHNGIIIISMSVLVSFTYAAGNIYFFTNFGSFGLSLFYLGFQIMLAILYYIIFMCKKYDKKEQ